MSSRQADETGVRAEMAATELTDAELDAAAGGLVVNAIIAVLINPVLPSALGGGGTLTPDQQQQLRAGNPLPRPR